MILIILIPLPLFFAQTVYGVGGLTAWVVIGIIWTFCSAFYVVIYPLYESRVTLTKIAQGIVRASFLSTASGTRYLMIPFSQDIFDPRGQMSVTAFELTQSPGSTAGDPNESRRHP